MSDAKWRVKCRSCGAAVAAGPSDQGSTAPDGAALRRATCAACGTHTLYRSPPVPGGEFTPAPFAADPLADMTMVGGAASAGSAAPLPKVVTDAAWMVLVTLRVIWAVAIGAAAVWAVGAAVTVALLAGRPR